MRRTSLMPILLALLLAGLCLTNLTGCAEKDAPPPDPAPVQNGPVTSQEPETAPAAPADGPLTAEELQYFNEEFFNGGYMNIRNQFLLSSYESPEWIDLYHLFYCGSGRDETITEEEWAAFEAVEGCPIETDVVKISAANVDAVLMEHMGVTLEDTNKIHWDNFAYLPEYDAYYIAHGDTNYMNVDISAGERKNGMINLYYSYNDSYYGEGWMCATLRETENGYQFVSNMLCDESDVPNT